MVVHALLWPGCVGGGNRLLIRGACWTGGNMKLSVDRKRNPREFSAVTIGATCQVYFCHLLGAEIIGPLRPLSLAA